MATNPKKITLFNKVTKQQLNTLAGGTSITKGSDTLTPQEGVGYLIPDTSVSFEAQTLTTEQKTQARTNIGAGTSNFSGSYNDLTDKPTIPTTTDTVTQGSTDALTSGGAYTAINNAISSVYKIQGSETISNLNSATKTESMNGYVYNISTGGTLNNQDASTLTVVAGDNVLFVWNNGTWYWDKLAGDIDLTGYVQKTTTIAGVDLQDNITKSELQTALDFNTKLDKVTTGAGVRLYGISSSNEQTVYYLDTDANANTVVRRTGSGTVKAATPTANEDAATKLYVDTAISGKQDSLSAGTGITITNNVVSMTGGLPYLTTAPSSANTDGLKLVVLSSEPATKYAGYFYIITE